MTTQGVSPIVIRHHRVDLALHRLAATGDGPRAAQGEAGRPLLCLHGLGESAASLPAASLARWPGPVWALDFTGHGASTVPVGGGYTAELLMGDADHALAHLGESAIVGFGLGAYVALLLAGARAAAVRGTVLADGPGLDGARFEPAALRIVAPVQTAEPGRPGPPVEPAPSGGPAAAPGGAPAAPDPYALAELAADVRPAAYARDYARAALAGCPTDPALVVATAARPPWLAAVLAEGAAPASGLDAGLDRLSAANG